MDETGIRIRLEVAEELFRELIRRGVLTQGAIDAVAERFAVRAANHAGCDREDFYALAAHQVAMLPIEAEGQEEKQSDRRAAFQRKQIRERTAMLSRPDGGKAPR